MSEPRVIDLRPILQSGGGPLDVILAAAEGVPVGEALVVVAPFEPVPLYGVMRQMGFSHEVERHGGAFRVTFLRD
jgi:hypothetical protein